MLVHPRTGVNSLEGCLAVFRIEVGSCRPAEAADPVVGSLLCRAWRSASDGTIRRRAEAAPAARLARLRGDAHQGPARNRAPGSAEDAFGPAILAQTPWFEGWTPVSAETPRRPAAKTF